MLAALYLSNPLSVAVLAPYSRRVFVVLTKHLYPDLHEQNRLAPELFVSSSTYSALQKVHASAHVHRSLTNARCWT